MKKKFMLPEKELTIDDVIAALTHAPSSTDKKLLIQAYDFAARAHEGQMRSSGVPYIQHCLHVARTLADIGMDSHTVIAGLLHDVPEDTAETLNTIKERFGDDVALMIDGITKLGKIKLRGTKEEVKLENWRRMFLAMAEDIRTVIIKLADRLHNMQTLDHLPPQKQQRIANETMEIYVPIANRLGIGEMRGRLSDLSFQYLDPKNYAYTQQIRDDHHKEADAYIARAVPKIKEALHKEKVRVTDIHGRAKYLYSLYKKLQKHDMNINKIYDFTAIRIIVPTVAECYKTLGIIHKHYRPLAGRIKDYISLPKPNGYQSIHTTVFGPDGRVSEIQIRTPQMHKQAEFGIAAHWLYNEKKSWRSYFNRSTDAPIKERDILWINQLRDWQDDIGADTAEFAEGLKIDFFKNHIFAFTPRGDVIDLPEEATMIDFAYAIHSEIGNHASGAKADGKMVSLDTPIANGQVIDILTDKNRTHPNKDWLTLAKTHTARAQIRRALRRKTEEDILKK